ncbi:MAG: peptidoglycan DD-metalloendopeptidase family protein [Candidatus Woesearchaeota archaeon]
MFNRNKKNKRGQIFVISVVIAVTIALISSFILLESMFREKNSDEFLGSYQSGIIDAIADGNKVELYVDQAAKMALSKSINEYIYGIPPILEGEDASEYSASDCGNYVYSLWNNESKNCYPNYLDTEDFKLNYLINKNLNELTKSDKSGKNINLDRTLSQSVSYDYKYYINDVLLTTKIYGIANSNYDIIIFRDLETRNNEEIQSYLTSKNTYSGTLIWPLGNEYTVSSCFGNRGSGTGGSTIHNALDIPAPLDTPVLAAADGTIEELIFPRWGKIIINHGGGIKTGYIHMNKIRDGLKKGDVVKQGEVIGYVGGRGANSEKEYAIHLHFEVLSSNVDSTLNYDGVSAVVKNIYVNPVCFIGHTTQNINFNMDSKSCNSICDDVKCVKVDPKDIDKVPYKFCNLYTNVVVTDPECLTSKDTDWKINSVTLSAEELTSKQTLVITMGVENTGDTCVNVRPEITISNAALNQQSQYNKQIFNGKSANIYKSTDSVKETTFTALTCIFSDDEELVKRETASGKCVILMPKDETEIEYNVYSEAIDNNNDRELPDPRYETIKVKKVSENTNVNNNNELEKMYQTVKNNIATLNLNQITVGEKVLIVDGNSGQETQKMYLVKEDNTGKLLIEKEYEVSLALKGFGSVSGSEKTPTGLHKISDKIGDNIIQNTIFISRVPQIGRLATIYTDQTNIPEDLITSRIMWLDGLEPSNQNTHSRLIYIHGTAEEGLIGTAQSHGCIRMKNNEVIELFNLINTGTYVYISEDFDSINTNNNNIAVPSVQLTAAEQQKIDKTRKNLEALGIMNYIEEITAKEGVPKEVLLGLITQESGGEYNAGSIAGAYGLTQVMTTIHKDRIQKECGSIETFKDDAQCQVRVGAGILKANYKSGQTIYYKCNLNCQQGSGYQSCNTGTTCGTKCIGPTELKTYTEWEAALRKYNGGGSASIPAAGKQTSGCTGYPDYEYVEKVMKYAQGWGYASTNQVIVHEEISQGIFGKYTITPIFNIDMDFDMRLFDVLKNFANNTVTECSKDVDDKNLCVSDNIRFFNNNLDQKYKNKKVMLDNGTNCDETEIQTEVNTLIEDISSCASSEDTNCQCIINLPESSKYTEVEKVESYSRGTVFTYRSNGEKLQVYLDNNITKEGSLWKQDRAMNINGVTIYKNNLNELKLGVNPTGSTQECAAIKNKFRFCLKTEYQYSIYSPDTEKIVYKNIKIPFALTIRDHNPPKPITGITATNLLHDANSIMLSWNRNAENDVVKYTIYLSNDKTLFDEPTMIFKRLADIKTITLDVTKKYNEYQEINIDTNKQYPSCLLTTENNIDYCKFEYSAVSKDGAPESLTLEKNMLYYITSENKFIYIIDGSNTYNGLTNELETDVEKSIVITATDIDGNEISNIHETQKIIEGNNTITITPKNYLEKGFVKISDTTINEYNQMIVTFEEAKNNIDGTTINNYDNINYNMYLLKLETPQTCSTDIYSLEYLNLVSSCTYNSYTGCGIDIANNDPGTYCLAVSAGVLDPMNPQSNNGIFEYNYAFLREVIIPPKANP